MLWEGSLFVLILLWFSAPCCVWGTLGQPGQPPASQPAVAEIGSVLPWIVVLEDPGPLPNIKTGAVAAMGELRWQHRDVVLHLQEEAAQRQAPVVAVLQRLVAEGSVVDYRCYHVACVIAVNGSAEAAAELAVLPEVIRVIPDDTLVSPMELVEPASSSLDDQVAQPGLVAIRAREVWDMGITGAGILLAHLDTGVNGAHPALQNRWRGAFGYPAAACWLDLAGNSTTPTDANGHGTMTMGIACAMVPGDTVGVAWGARFISARLNFSTGLISTALTALQWVLDPDGDPQTVEDVPRVLSNSWGLEAAAYQDCYDVFNAALDNCEEAGIALLWAAGNEGHYGAGTIRVPADRAIDEGHSFAVGAYDRTTDSLWFRSSRGPSPCAADPGLAIKPELVAPGRDIRSTSLGTSYGSGSGTSFSVPHAAGTAALMLEANPLLLPDSLKEILLLTAVDKGEPGNDNGFGYGHLDAYAAVMGALGGIGWIHGHVTNLFGDGLPAAVTVAGHPQWSRADSSGDFTLVLPAAQPYELRVASPLFAAWSGTVTPLAGDTLRLDLVLDLADTCGALTGLVIDCLGDPAAGAEVRIDQPDVPLAIADGDGRFHLVLVSGQYDALASDGFCAEARVEDLEIVGGGITDVEIVLPANPAHQCSPPEAYGYQACDDRDPDGPSVRWAEIARSAGGRGVVHNLSDDATVPLGLPFPVRYYGTTWNRIHLNSNGTLSFGRGSTSYSNTSLPRLFAPMLYPFWDDLNDMDGGEICTWHDPVRGTFIVEWYQVPHHGSAETETFQVIFYDTSVAVGAGGNTVVEFQYRDLTQQSSCTVGLEGPAGSGYLQYALNGAYPAHASPLLDGRAIRLATGPVPREPSLLWLAAANYEFGLLPGQSVDTALVLINGGLSAVPYVLSVPGESWTGYTWSSSNDPDGPAYEFIDIGDFGTPTGLVVDDTTGDPTPLPWQFPLFGRWFDRVAVSSNGFLSFVSCVDERSWYYSPMNDQHDPFYLLAPYWLDLNVARGGRILTHHDTLRDCFIVQWDGIRRYYNDTGPNTFQVVLYHDGTIDFAWETMTAPLNSGAVGIKGWGGTEFVQLAFNQPFVESNTRVRFALPDTAGMVCQVRDRRMGVVPAGSSLQIPLRLTNRHVTLGRSAWSLEVAYGDPETMPLVAEVQAVAVSDPSLLRVVIVPDEPGIRLHWNPVSGANYCVYSSTPAAGGSPVFETCVADTFAVLPYSSADARLFEVRLCDASPSAPVAGPAVNAGTVLRNDHHQ